jgi:hypothetical protein
MTLHKIIKLINVYSKVMILNTSFMFQVSIPTVLYGISRMEEEGRGYTIYVQ